MAKTTRRNRTAAEWSKLVQAWEESGESAASFAASRDFSPRTLCWWRWRLGRGPKAANPSTPRRAKKEPTPRLVEVKVESPTEVAEEVAWELETATAVLRVHTGISPTELDRILAAISGKERSA